MVGALSRRARVRQIIGWSFWLSGVAALATTSCVTSPHSKIAVQGDVITFTGLYPYASGLGVKVQVEEANSSFTTLATAPVQTDNSWSVSVTVPDSYFAGVCTHANFRVVTNERAPHLLNGFEDACYAALPPNPTSEQLGACTTGSAHRYQRGQ